MANEYTTLPGQLAASGLNSLVDLANKYKDNPEIAGLVAGTLADSYKTQVNTAQSLQYNDAYLGSLGKYQEALENLRKGNTMELMGQESAVTERLQGQQISGQKDLANIQAATTRYGYDKDLEGIKNQTETQRYGFDTDLKGTDIKSGRELEAAKESAGAQRFGYEQQFKGTDVSSARELEGTKETAGASRFAADVSSARQLEGQKYGYESQEKQIGLTGREERETLKEKYAQEKESQLALRADARGAIARAGSRFYG